MMMMTSSASRREAARSFELGRAAGGGAEPPRPSAAAMARSGELTAAAEAVRHEGWMLRYGRRKIGRSFVRTRYFVLDNKLLSYYKKQPKDSMVPVKALQVDGNCRVEDRGLKTHHGQMGANDIEDVLIWKKKLELLIDQVYNWKSYSIIDLKMRKSLALLCFAEQLLGMARSCSRSMRAVGVVEASCESIFGLIMSMDVTRYEWDCSFQYGSLVEEVDGWSGPGIFVMYDIGGAMMMEVMNCGPQPGFVRAFIERLREYFSQTDDIHPVPRIPVMSTMANVSSLKKDKKFQEADFKTKQADMGQIDNKNLDMIDEESEEDDDYQVPDADLEEEPIRSDSDTKFSDPIDLSCFSGIIRQDANEKSRNCWAVPDSKLFKVRSESFPHDKSKVPASKYLMELVAIDWFKDFKRMDHVARRKGCAAQVAAEKGMFTFVVNIQIPGSSHYSLVLYFVTRSLEKGSLLQRFADGDDDFRNSRLKLIPSVPKGSWIVRQSVGSTPCLLGKAVDCSYMRGPEYIEVDVDIGSSAVANGVLGLVFGVVTTLVVDMAFLIQANTYDELPEQLLGAARLSNIEPSSAIVPALDNTSSAE
uniref:PH domain-containing protein n=1 Tax=Leersia perrieri TaxID=77586 RepID=A0A0D9WL51_9ORYZ